MTVTPKIKAFDTVELIEQVEDAPAGARGGILELRKDGVAMVEITEPPLGGATRIVFVSLDKLHRVSRAPTHS